MAAKLTLDRFELLWWCEGFVGKSHLRWDGYERMVNDVFPQLSEDERECIYAYVKRDLSWHFEGKYVDETPHEYFKQMLARYNPANQYKVMLKNGNECESVIAYKWNGKYYTCWNRICNEDFIVHTKHLPYKRCCNKYCGSRNKCLRYKEVINEGEDEIEGTRLFACDKCDLIIEQVENKEDNNNINN